MAQISREEFDQLYQSLVSDNNTGSITPENLRVVFDNLSDSAIWFDESTSGAVGPTGGSAYEVAVANGFAGTEAEWLSSLVGLKGNDGTQGLAGQDGEPGLDGRTVRDVRVAEANIFTVSEDDDGVVIRNLSGGATVTLPLDAAAPLRNGCIVHFMQDGEDSVRLVASAGVSMDVLEGYLPQTAGVGRAITALKLGPDHWRVHGDLTPAPDLIPFASGGAVSGVRVATGTTSLSIEDAGGLVEVASDVDVIVTLPSDASAPIPLGAVIHIAQAEVGAVTFNADTDTSVLVCAAMAQRTSGQHGVVRAIKSAPNTWRLTGDLATFHAFA